LQTGTQVAVFENTFTALPTGRAGKGLEIGISSGTALFNAYDRTGSALFPFQIDALTIFLNANTSVVATLGVGNATPSSSGAGITFPATQSASSNANTLDDYEEGTFTVTFVPNTSGTISLSSDTCSYTKVGRAVTITGFLKVSSVSSPLGYLKISGLPFGGGGSAGQFRQAIAIDGGGMNVTMTTVLTATIQGDTNIYVFKPDGLGGQSATTAADMKLNTEIFIGGTYIIA